MLYYKYYLMYYKKCGNMYCVIRDNFVIYVLWCNALIYGFVLIINVLYVIDVLYVLYYVICTVI